MLCAPVHPAPASISTHERLQHLQLLCCRSSIKHIETPEAETLPTLPTLATSAALVTLLPREALPADRNLEDLFDTALVARWLQF